MRRFHILTHPFEGNYGGMLQAFALQCALNRININNFVLEYKRPFRFRFLLIKFRGLIKMVLRGKLCYHLLSQIVRTACIKRFKPLIRFSHLSLLNMHGSEYETAFIVGSDQVWRAEYGRVLLSVEDYFLSFATSDERNRSISYAASFGCDEWDGNRLETEVCAKLLREFKAVSVREHSGVKICKEVFGVDAVQMPDPTLLLHSENYGKIIDSEKTWLPDGKYVAAYVLDETAGKAELQQNSAKSVDMQLQHLMPHADAKKRRDRFPISVPQWLRLIRDCEYFITDSFHGCVFAIIYNKPFVCLGNEGRGNARFDTLLGTFGLEDRMITDATPEKVLQVLHTPIDWKRVNAIHDSERERGINFLKENLCE